MPRKPFFFMKHGVPMVPAIVSQETWGTLRRKRESMDPHNPAQARKPPEPQLAGPAGRPHQVQGLQLEETVAEMKMGTAVTVPTFITTWCPRHESNV